MATNIDTQSADFLLGKLTPGSYSYIPPADKGIVSDTSAIQNNMTDLNNNIVKGLSQYGIAAPDKSSYDNLSTKIDELFNTRETTMTDRYNADKSSAEKTFSNEKEQLKIRQADEEAQAEGRTRIGGFFTSIEGKQILDLKRQHDLDMSALQSKHQDTLLQAQRAYEDQNYELATDKLKAAKDLENDMNNRKETYFNDVMQYSTFQKNQNATKDAAEKSWDDYKKTALTNGAKVDVVKKAEALFAAGKEDEARALLSPYTGTKTNQVVGYDKDGNPVYSSAPGSNPSSKLLTSFNSSLIGWSASQMKTETREQFIRRLQAQYGYDVHSNPNGFDKDDIARKVYQTYPDGYDNLIKDKAGGGFDNGIDASITTGINSNVA